MRAASPAPSAQSGAKILPAAAGACGEFCLKQGDEFAGAGEMVPFRVGPVQGQARFQQMHMRILAALGWRRQAFGIAAIDPVFHPPVQRIQQRPCRSDRAASVVQSFTGHGERVEREGEIIRVGRIVDIFVAICVERATHEAIFPPSRTAEGAHAMMNQIK